MFLSIARQLSIGTLHYDECIFRGTFSFDLDFAVDFIAPVQGLPSIHNYAIPTTP